MTSTKSFGGRPLAYGLVFAVALIFRLLTLHLPTTGGDELHYFDCAWQLVHQPQTYQLDHQSARWGIILPLVPLRALFGNGALIYTLMALGLSLMAVLVIMRAGELLRSTMTGTLAALFVVFFPGIIDIDIASNLSSESFLVFYLPLTAVLLLEYRKRKSRGTGFLIAAGIVFVLAWFTKVTAISFLPGFLFLAYQRERKHTPVLVFAGVFVLFVAVETIVYKVIWNEPFGIVSVILRTHLSADNHTLTQLSSIWGLAQRYSKRTFDLYWWPFVLLAVVLFVDLIRRREMSRVWFLIIAEVGFFLELTFGVKSLHPVVTLEPFVSRYFLTGFPFLALFIAFGLASFVERVGWTRINSFSLSIAGLAMIVVVEGLVALPATSHKWKIRFLPLNEHPFVVLPRYEALAQQQRAQNWPVIGLNPGDSEQSYKAAYAYAVLFDRSAQMDRDQSVSLDHEVAPGAIELGTAPALGPDLSPVIWVEADPLRIQQTTLASLRAQGKAR